MPRKQLLDKYTLEREKERVTDLAYGENGRNRI